MPVKFSHAKFKPSNKPQPFPKPKPPFELFPTGLTLSDGRLVRISLPVPDRLTLVVNITSDIYGANAPPDCTVEQWVMHTGHYLQAIPHNTHFLSSQYFEKKKWFKQVTLGMGQRDSGVRFEFSEATKKQAAQLRLEMNPRKLGKKGFKVLLAILNDPSGPFSCKALLKAARVTRVDIAVDVEGVQTSDIVAMHAIQQQRSLYMGADGLLESFYIHGKPTKAKPAGKVLLSIYDRVRERQKKGKPAPFGPSPVTRIEITKSPKAPHNSLADLAKLTDPFAKIRVGYVMDQGAAPEGWWRQYVSLRRTNTHEQAVELLGLSFSTSSHFAEAIKVPSPVFAHKGHSWKGWPDGMKYTGLNTLICAGQAP